MASEQISTALTAFGTHHIRTRSRGRHWMLIAVLMWLTLATSVATEFELVWKSWLLPAGLATAFIALSWFYTKVRRADDGRIAETLHETAILIAYGPSAAALSYIVVAPALPLLDAQFAAMDLALGFDWPAWYRWVEARPAVETMLAILYASSLPHIAVMLISTGLIGRTDRTRELNALLIVTSLPMVLMSGITPAMSAWIHHDLGLEKAYHLAHVTGLRDGSFRVLEVGQLLGIITFPSFHTAISLVLLWVSRGIPWLFWPSAFMGIGVLVSIPSEGGHYLVDMLAAAAITGAAILFVRQRR